MSHSPGEVVCKQTGKTLAYYEYNGTSDVAISHLYDTAKERDDNWRSEGWNNCGCKAPPIDVYLTEGNEYCGLCYWEAQVCLNCKVIVSGFSKYWRRDQCKLWAHDADKCQDCQWPRSGRPKGEEPSGREAKDQAL